MSDEVLADYIRQLGDTAIDTDAIGRAVVTLADHFGALAIWRDDPDDATPSDRGLALSHGEAIAPEAAACCMRDALRTFRFHRGIGAALDTLLATSPVRPLHVVYAGCGPFATLVVPLMPRFAPADVQFHLWDAHERALGVCRRLVARLGLAAHVAEYRCVDASAAGARPAFPIHAIVIEAMQALLEKEPQVAIAARLAPWLEPEGLFLPERIELIATMLDPSRQFTHGGVSHERVREDLGVAFALDRESAVRIGGSLGADGALPAEIPAQRLRVPVDGSGELWVRTRIRIFGGEALDDYDSGLTSPRPAPLETPAPPGAEVAFRYELGVAPGLRGDVLEVESSSSRGTNQ